MDVSIGTQSLMHPVDWLEVNAKNGLTQQPLPDANETTWFETGNVSILKTPHDRKSYPRLLLGLGDEESGGRVVHTVSTDLEFCMDVPVEEKRAAILRVRDGNARGDTSFVPNEPVPFSTIKKEPAASAAMLNRSLARSKRSLFGAPASRTSLDDSDSDDNDDEPTLGGPGDESSEL
jgi:hypothetical protein